MTTLEHDGAASLRVEYRNSSGHNSGAGWRAVRICPCHHSDVITVPFETRAEAERALAVLDADARRYGSPPTRSAGT